MTICSLDLERVEPLKVPIVAGQHHCVSHCPPYKSGLSSVPGVQGFVCVFRLAQGVSLATGSKMIRFVFLQNRAGKTRLAKYYVPMDDKEKHRMEYEVHRLVVGRDPKNSTNFAEFQTYKVGEVFCFLAGKKLGLVEFE